MTDPQPQTIVPPERAGLLWYHLWTAVFGLNLVIPLLFAKMMTGGGLGGIVAAIGLLWLAGALAGSKSRRARSDLMIGGSLLALSQPFPIVQVFAGMLSLKVVIGVLNLKQDQLGAIKDLTEFGGFLASILTGGALLLIARAVGPTARWFSGLGTSRDGPTKLT